MRDFLSMYQTPKWIDSDGSLNTDTLFLMFTKFWRENSDAWTKDMAGFLEVAPHITFQAFLQRIANGSGNISREYALGSGRLDLLLEWKNPKGKDQTIAVEIKLHSEHTTLKAVKEKGKKQTAKYADTCGATEAHLLIFNRRENIDWEEKIWTEEAEQNGRKIKIWGM